jgi:hypothetical protein
MVERLMESTMELSVFSWRDDGWNNGAVFMRGSFKRVGLRTSSSVVFFI